MRYLLSVLAALLLSSAAQAQTSFGVGPWINSPNPKTALYTAVATDCGSTLALGGASAYQLTVNAATGYTGACVIVALNTDAVQNKTIAVNGLANVTLTPNQSVLIYRQGSAWFQGLLTPASGGNVTVASSAVGGGTTNQLLYDNAGVLGEVTKCNNGAYVTNVTGVPSCSSTLPFIVGPSQGGTGVANSVNLSVTTNAGTLAFGNASKTLTVNKSLTLDGTDAKTLTLNNSGTLTGGDGFTLSIAAGKTHTVSNSLQFTGTDGTSFGFPSTSDTVAVLGKADQAITGGATMTAFDNGTVGAAGSFTIDCGKNPLQKVVNNSGTGTMVAPNAAVDSSCIMKVTNGASSTAAFITSGFTNGANTGDAPDGVVGHVFYYSIWCIGSTCRFTVAAGQ